VTTTGQFGEFSVPTAASEPEYITVGPDGALWFTENSSGKIGRITTAGIITDEFPGASSPKGIVAGPDGALWFTEEVGNIGRITTGD
jgi:virginiamycin B lyase